ECCRACNRLPARESEPHGTSMVTQRNRAGVALVSPVYREGIDMFCDQCGTRLNEGQKFCNACGKPLAGIPAAPSRRSMEGHIKLLGILWLAISGFRLLPSMFLLGMRHGRFPFPNIPHFVLPIMGLVGGFILVCSILGFITGWGLLERQSWARPLAV